LGKRLGGGGQKAEKWTERGLPDREIAGANGCYGEQNWTGTGGVKKEKRTRRTRKAWGGHSWGKATTWKRGAKTKNTDFWGFFVGLGLTKGKKKNDEG